MKNIISETQKSLKSVKGLDRWNFVNLVMFYDKNSADSLKFAEIYFFLKFFYIFSPEFT